MATDDEIGFPKGNADERELLLSWLGYLRGAVRRNLEGLTEREAHGSADGTLIPLLGVVNHLTHVEWRWIDGAMLGHAVTRSDEEFRPGAQLTVDRALEAYQERAGATDAFVRATALATPCGRGEGLNLRWVVLHLINETARHAGHADATRQLLDGSTGE